MVAITFSKLKSLSRTQLVILFVIVLGVIGGIVVFAQNSSKDDGPTESTTKQPTTTKSKSADSSENSNPTNNTPTSPSGSPSQQNSPASSTFNVTGIKLKLINF